MSYKLRLNPGETEIKLYGGNDYFSVQSNNSKHSNCK